MLLHIKDLPFSTSVDVSALRIKSRRSVEGTSPWLSLMTPALKVVGHLSMNLLAVCSPNITLKSCSICSLKKKKKKKRRTTWVGTLCYILQYVSVFNECRCHTSPGVSRNRGNTEKTSADLFSSLTMAWRYAKVTFIFSRMVSSSAVCLNKAIVHSTSSSVRTLSAVKGLVRPWPGPPTLEQDNFVVAVNNYTVSYPPLNTFHRLIIPPHDKYYL